MRINQLMERWQAHGIACPPGVTVADIEDFERARGVVLPPDMRTYFLTVNGMGEYGTCDNDFISFWRLQDLKTVAEVARSHVRFSGCRNVLHVCRSLDRSTNVRNQAICGPECPNTDCQRIC